MNYMSHDLVRSRMQDISREAERESRIKEAHRHSKLAVARSEQSSSWNVMRRFPALVASAIFSFGA